MSEDYNEYFNRLKKLKNPKGDFIIKSKEELDRFWNDGDSLSLVMRFWGWLID